MTSDEVATQARLERAREALSRKYGNLYGVKLKRWFVFNGEDAITRGDSGMLTYFEMRLEGLRNSKGSSAVHRARREAWHLRIDADRERFAELRRLDEKGDLFRDNEHERARIQAELDYFEDEYGWTLKDSEAERPASR